MCAGFPAKGEHTLSRGVKIITDVSFSEICDQEFDAIILPGGKKQAETVRHDEGIRKVKCFISSSLFVFIWCSCYAPRLRCSSSRSMPITRR